MSERDPSQIKVIVGLSGGVDSSVAALLLKEQGYQVQGLFMKNWEEDDTSEFCSIKEDLEDVRAVSKKLDIPLHTINFAHEYWQDVFSHFLDEYKSGRTPNPDILCNKEIKFKAFLNHAIKLGADYIATGHYAKISKNQALYSLQEAKDCNKDQTYFLYTLGQAQLAKTLFPLADLTKPEIRKIAQEANLITHNKKDSTGICFIGERPFDEFLAEYLVGKPGKIKTPQGQILGEHAGLIFYTLGQRKGLHIGGVKGAKNAPWYVVAKDLDTDTLYVAQDEHPWGYASKLKAIELHWVKGVHPENKCMQARIRYRQSKQNCTLEMTEEGANITFEKPQFAATPGQAIVLYQNGHCLGGATIQSTNSPGGIIQSTQSMEESLCTP
jgi:tRNA-uridine 2-sulfurtransferase